MFSDVLYVVASECYQAYLRDRYFNFTSNKIQTNLSNILNHMVFAKSKG